MQSSTFGQVLPELVLPVGHTESVYDGIYSPDGKFLLTASGDATAKIWSSRTAQLVHSLEGHTNYVLGASWSTDGTKVLTSGRNEVRIWDVSSGRMLLEIKPHRSAINLASWSPDGNKILTTSLDRALKVWDAGTGELLLELEDFPQAIYCVSWSPDSKKFLLSSWSAPAEIRDLQTGEILCTLRKYADHLNSADWSPDGSRILSTSNTKIPMVWDAEKGKMLFALQGNHSEVNTASWSPDGKKILTASADSTTIIWEGKNGKVLHVIREEGGYVREAEWSPDGRSIASASTDGSLSIYDVSTGAKICEPDAFEAIARSICWSPDNRYLLTTDGGLEPRIWNVGSGRQTSSLTGHTSELTSARFLPEEASFLAGSDDGFTRKWDLLSGKVLRRTRNIFQSASTLSPDRTKMLVKTDDFKLKVLEAASGKTISTCEVYPETLRSIEWFPNSKKIFLSSRDKLARIIDTETGESLFELDGQDEYLGLSMLSPDRTMFMTQSHYGTTKVWDVSTGGLLQSFYGYTSYIAENSWSPDSKSILALDSDSVASILDVASGNKTGLYPGHRSSISSLLWSSGGNRITTSSYDRTSKIWDAGSGRLLFSLVGMATDIKTIYSSPGPEWMFTDSWEGRFHLWDLQNGALLFSYTGPGEIISRIIWNSDKSKFLGVYEKKICLWDKASEGPESSVGLGLFSFEDVDFRKGRSISLYNSQLKLNDLSSGNEIAQFIAIDSADYFVKTPDNYYLASKNGLKWVGFKVNQRQYSFEQFDLKYNRPDIVLQRLGNTDSTLIGLYKRAYLKRLRKMGFREENLGENFHIPETRIRDFENPPAMGQGEADLKLEFRDSLYKLERYFIYVNGVPIYGRKGKSMGDQEVDTFSITETIRLTPGNNHIQVSCMNNKGAESYKESVELNYQPELALKPDLYLVCVGVSDYKDDRYDLKYADKDGRDLVNFYQSGSSLYANIFLDTLFNARVTPERVRRIKSHLQQSKENDHVVMLISGHGILDDSLDFYFASHPMDFSEPSKQGILYEEFEDLLDGIPARNKMLLIDACHSGEIDKDEVEEYLAISAVKGEMLFLKGDAERRLKVNALSEIMNGLFVDIRSGNGATVLTAAKGDEFAEESAMLGNGVFTYALITGLKSMAADMDGDGQVDLEELSAYVIGEVNRITAGRQMPTARQESFEFNHRVW